MRIEDADFARMHYVVIAAHRTVYPEPLEFSPGDRLILGRMDEEYPGWIWVTAPSGRHGWAPELAIRCETNDEGVALAEYTARELDTVEGERVRCLRDLAGWLWVENEQGRTGWIPKKSVSDMPGRSATSMDDRWAAGEAYEAFMGRWSRLLADRFVGWLEPEAGLAWLDVGCGTGALTSTICKLAAPASVVACDLSLPFVEHTRRNISDSRLSVVHAGAGGLPSHPGGFDFVVSGLVFNFFPDPLLALEEMRRLTRPGGVNAAYVWDYAGRMEFLRAFWDEAVALDEGAKALDEGERFPLCRPAALESLFQNAGLRDVDCEPIDIPTPFESFAEYWQSFSGGTGPAPSYVASLSGRKRAELRDRLERRFATGPDDAIDLIARAWAIRGTLTGENV